MKRAAVIAHFDLHNIVDDYVVYYVRCLRELCSYLVFVTTSDLPDSEISKMNGICDQVVCRENIGYDFISYKVGLQYLEGNDYDEVLLCNDSVYGPIYPLAEMFEKMQNVECGFWGVTQNYDKAYHLQSYFLVFRESVLKSDYFREFWGNLSVKNTKQEIIDEYEVGLSQILMKNGARASAYSVYKPSLFEIIRLLLKSMKKPMSSNISTQMIKELSVKIKDKVPGLLFIMYKKKLNPTHFFWKQLIESCRMPFIKQELLRVNPKGMDIQGYENLINSLSDYNTDYIRKHLERIRMA